MGPKELLEKDVVLVEIQYRLGPLGFMCLDHDEIAGNMGMLDQVRTKCKSLKRKLKSECSISGTCP